MMIIPLHSLPRRLDGHEFISKVTNLDYDLNFTLIDFPNLVEDIQVVGRGHIHLFYRWMVSIDAIILHRIPKDNPDTNLQPL